LIRLLRTGFRGIRLRSRQIAYHDAVRDTIAEGCRTGEFRVADVSMATMAILDMLDGIRECYSPAGRLSRDEVIGRYTDMVVTMLGPGPARDGAPGPAPEEAAPDPAPGQTARTRR
jgi:hypothetical protein